MRACEGYCPKQIVRQLDLLGFTSCRPVTPYGAVQFYLSRPTAERTCTLLLHGAAADASTWTPMLQCARDLGIDLGNLLVVDLPGFGRSENRLDTMDIHEVGNMLMDQVTAIGFERVRLLGHSMGGFLALDMASRYPDRVTSVHVAAGAYFGILNTIKAPFKSLVRIPRTAILWNSYHALCLAGPAGTAVVRAASAVLGPQCVIAPFVAEPARMQRQVVETLITQLNPRGVVLTARNGPDYDATETWGAIKVPLTAVFGSADRLVTEKDASELKRTNPHARIETVQDVGHLMILERPATVLRALDL